MQDHDDVQGEEAGRSRLRALVAGLLALVFLVATLATLLSEAASEQTAARSLAAGRALPAGAVASAEALMAQQVSARVYPGAVLAAGIGGRTLVLRGVGRLEWRATSAAASPGATLYDLASLSKAVATTTAVLLLVQDGRIRLDDPVRRWLPEFDGRWKDQVTWRHLLTHTSGLPPAGHMSGSTPAARIASLLRTRLNEPPGTAMEYSDLGYVVVWNAAQRAAGEPLPRFLARRVWRPLGMTHTRYLPGPGCESCAPTLVLKDGTPFRGTPSDPMARKLGSVTGNAGLFSTAADLGRFAAMIAGGGELDGVRILRSDLVRELVTQQPNAGRRTLGWDAFCPAEGDNPHVPCRKAVAFGHYGWTGTSLWLDPSRELWVVLLANRSFDVLKPRSMEPVREGVFAALAGERLSPPPQLAAARPAPSPVPPAAPPSALVPPASTAIAQMPRTAPGPFNPEHGR